MADWSDVMAATRAVVDPSTSAEDLASIAQGQKGLWVQIASHPNAYPALLDWLSSQGDEAVRAAVASRQQPTQSSTPVPPPPPLNEPSAVRPVPKRSKKSLLMGGIGVLVVVVALVITLIVHFASSTLRYDQLQAFVENLPGELEEPEITSGIDMIPNHSSEATGNSCQEISYGLGGKILGGVSFDEHDNDFMHDNWIFILSNNKDALSFSESIVICLETSDTAPTKVASRKVNNVSLTIWNNPPWGEQEVRTAVYKNVVWIADVSDDDTRGEWQTYATTTFKTAVDQAIKS